MRIVLRVIEIDRHTLMLKTGDWLLLRACSPAIPLRPPGVLCGEILIFTRQG